MKANEIIQLALKGWKLTDIKELAELEKTANENDANIGDSVTSSVNDEGESTDSSSSTDGDSVDNVDYKAECEKLRKKLENAQKANTRSNNDSSDNESDFEHLLKLAEKF